MSTTPRKPAQSAVGVPTTRKPRLPLRPVREQIWAAACDLVAIGETRELSEVLANRFHTSEAVVDRCLLLEGLRHQREAAALRTGIFSALEAARNAGASVVDDEAVA